MAVEIPALSKQYFCVPVAELNGADISGDTVQFAFLTSTTAPAGGDWLDGDFEDLGGGVYYARCMVGPSATAELSAGTYYVWVKVTDAPEVPVFDLGPVLVIT